jgi:hypothetical protein
MMVFPHFLALATLVAEDGQILLAGDHRQLAPIMAHDWDREDRPPIELYQPHLSAYDAIAQLGDNAHLAERSVRRSALELTFRLPPRIVDLIGRVEQLAQHRFHGESPQCPDRANRLTHSPPPVRPRTGYHRNTGTLDTRALDVFLRP